MYFSLNFVAHWVSVWFYKDIEKQFRIKNVNLTDSVLLLENKDSRIILTFKELLDHSGLIRQVNSLDLVKWIYPYACQEGYNSYQRIVEKERRDKL